MTGLYYITHVPHVTQEKNMGFWERVSRTDPRQTRGQSVCPTLLGSAVGTFKPPNLRQSMPLRSAAGLGLSSELVHSDFDPPAFRVSTTRSDYSPTVVSYD